jgi:NAD(P)-dependent dehydrogenase (short-subunit alcohol dehydrogenase family)
MANVDGTHKFEVGFMLHKKTAIVTGTEQAIGASLVQGFLKDSYNVVATSLNATGSLTASFRVALVHGDFRNQETVTKAVSAAIAHFETIATHGDDKMRLQAMRGTAVKLLTKPFYGESLFEAVRVALEG